MEAQLLARHVNFAKILRFQRYVSKPNLITILIDVSPIYVYHANIISFKLTFQWM